MSGNETLKKQESPEFIRGECQGRIKDCPSRSRENKRCYFPKKPILNRKGLPLHLPFCPFHYSQPLVKCEKMRKNG